VVSGSSALNVGRPATICSYSLRIASRPTVIVPGGYATTASGS